MFPYKHTYYTYIHLVLQVDFRSFALKFHILRVLTTLSHYTESRATEAK